MSGHECDRALRDLEEYLHREFSTIDAVEITRHLEECVDCADEYRIGVVLTEVVKRSCRDVAPEELREQVVVRLRMLSRS